MTQRFKLFIFGRGKHTIPTNLKMHNNKGTSWKSATVITFEDTLPQHRYMQITIIILELSSTCSDVNSD